MTLWMQTIAALALAASQDTSQGMSWERYAEVREHVLPSGKEQRWLRIPWRSRLWDAVEQARQERKPILLWAMNGHPLGCV